MLNNESKAVVLEFYGETLSFVHILAIPSPKIFNQPTKNNSKNPMGVQHPFHKTQKRIQTCINLID